MAYTNFTHCTTNEYKQVIYSQDDKNRAKIWFNGTELQYVGRLCEKITKKSRILAENGKKIFALDGFISTELEIILHNVDIEDIQDPVEISIGTLVDVDNNTYEDVPLGIFNIQDTPVVNDNKITLKLRDNRVKFDFNYNAKPLIDAHGGSATKRQILEDICLKAGVQHDIQSFQFENDEIGIYDDSVKANTYISYLAEQCGCIAIIDRDGKLKFLDLTDLYTWRIPRRLLPKPYTVGTPYTIQRVVYEQGIIKYESSADENLDTLYLNGANVYIDRQEQIDYIYNLLSGFTLDSVVTQKMLGSPAIDPWDLVEVYDDRDVSEPTIFKTFANNIYYFNGKHSQLFSTEIGKEQRKENITKNSQETFNKYARTNIDNLTAQVNIQAGEITEQQSITSDLNIRVGNVESAISEISDITVSGESIMATIDLADINESEPIQLKVRPIGTNINHLLPSNTLYPSNDLILKVRTITFYNNTQHSLIFEYELPEDLLYYNDEIYDEFYLDYGDGTPQGKICQVIKKCKYNSDGTVGLLNTPEIHTYPYPSITLTQGDYTISITSYSHGYIFARLMCQNMYTTQFYTKAEVNSQINQAASEINLVVAEKLDEDEFTHAKIVEKINDNTSFVQIDADKVDISANDVLNILSGNTINLTGKNIEIESDNFNVDSEGNAIMSSATITDGLLKIGNKEIFNANGVLTNLIFPCEIWGWLNENAYYQQGGGFIGFNYDFDGSVKQSFLNFTIPLPSNFVPIDARIKLRHTPVTWINPDGTQTQQGACTNMRAYVTSGLENYAGASYNSYFVIGGNPPTFTLINEIDSHDFSNSQFQEYTTENFANRLNGGNTYNISVKTTTVKPTAVTAQNAYQVLGQHTGVLNGYIQVIGYYKI